MYKLPLIFVLALVGTAAWAQETESDPAGDAQSEEAQAETEAATPAEDVTDEEIEELLGLDDDYREAEEEFDPTEEVRFEQNILFPTDI